jgi:hypothetical protein
MDEGQGAQSARKSKSGIRLQLKPSVSIDLRVEAKRRGIEYDDLAAEIIDAVVKNQLYAAVLDH